MRVSGRVSEYSGPNDMLDLDPRPAAVVPRSPGHPSMVAKITPCMPCMLPLAVAKLEDCLFALLLTWVLPLYARPYHRPAST